MNNAITVVLALVLIGPQIGWAADQQDSSSRPAPALQAKLDMTEGQVRKIDKSARKLTLRHGEIRNLEMPPMTMVFQVRDATLLDKVQVGDKVRFRAEQVGGAYVVTAIEALK